MYRWIKRITDVVGSLTMIVLLAPIGLLTAVAIKLTSPGPVFFVQPRGGRDGQPFASMKFRTMRTDHVHDITEVVPLSHTAITPMGRFLRRWKIDELPQLFNVLVGDMSLIGPRPTIMEQVRAYDNFQRRRQEIRPGLTGLAQISGGTAISWPQRIAYDVYYVDHLGLWLDLTILAKTVLVVVLGESRFAQPFEASPYAKRSGRPE